MTRRERLRACAAWTREWPDLPAQTPEGAALGSALAGYQASAPAWRLADGLLAVLGRMGATDAAH